MRHRCGHVGSHVVADLDDSVLEALRHRGPDAQRTERCATGDVTADLAFARLAIVDLSDAGQQPMSNEDGRPLIVVRNSTERPESVDAGFAYLVQPGPVISERLAAIPRPYGDGKANRPIVRLLRTYLG